MTATDPGSEGKGRRLEFVQQLRGIASFVVVIGAHMLGVFWLSPPAVRSLIGVPNWEPAPIPQFVSWLQQFPPIGFGHLGVAVFFLISGFVIPFSVKSLGPFRFLIARFFRIYPTYVVGFGVGLLALFVSARVWGVPWPWELRHILIHTTLTRDLFWLPPIDGISWTLEVEIKFYLLAALLAPVLIRGNLRALLCVALFGGALFLWTGNDLELIGRSMPSLARLILALQISWVMITFMFIGTLFHFHLVRAISTWQLALCATVLFALFAVEWDHSLLKAQIYGVANYGAAVAFFLAFYLRRDRPFRSRVLHFLGNISYPLYVIHPLVGYVGLALALRAGFTPIASLAIVVPLIFCAAYALHRIVENPSIVLGHYLVRRAGDAEASNPLRGPNEPVTIDGATSIARDYARRIWATRYFWTHLVAADLRAKYRRSSLGLLWAVIHPLALTALLSLVMSRVFGSPIVEYAPFIFSGLILWEFVISIIMTGCNAFINSEGYIRQFPHPLVIYSLRSTLSALVNLSLGIAGLLVWVAFWRPENLLAAIPLLPVALACYFAVGWPIATLAAFFGTRYRDLPQFLVIALQAIWYLSPVFFEPKLFRNAGVGWLVDWNPVYYLLDLMRSPFLGGTVPPPTTWIWFLGCLAFAALWALLVVRKSERSLIFYL